MGYRVQTEEEWELDTIIFLSQIHTRLTTINENCLHHYPYNDQTLMRKSDEDLIVTGNHDSLADRDPDIGLHLIQNNQCNYYNITAFNSAITDKDPISILDVNI